MRKGALECHMASKKNINAEQEAAVQGSCSTSVPSISFSKTKMWGTSASVLTL